MDPNYDFILNQQPNKRSSLPAGSQKQRLLMVAGGALILFILGAIFFAVLNAGNKSPSDIYLPLLATQSDIIEMTSDGSKDAGDIKLQNQSTTVNAVISSHSSSTSAKLGKVDTKLLASYRNNEYQAELEKAKNSGSYDKTYQALLNNRLDLYRQQLVTSYSDASDAKSKKELESFYSQVGALMGEQTTPQ